MNESELEQWFNKPDERMGTGVALESEPSAPDEDIAWILGSDTNVPLSSQETNTLGSGRQESEQPGVETLSVNPVRDAIFNQKDLEPIIEQKIEDNLAKAEEAALKKIEENFAFIGGNLVKGTNDTYHFQENIKKQIVEAARANRQKFFDEYTKSSTQEQFAQMLDKDPDFPQEEIIRFVEERLNQEIENQQSNVKPAVSKEIADDLKDRIDPSLAETFTDQRGRTGYIGAGAMGDVWKVNQYLLDRDEAMKFARFAKVVDPDTVSRFDREMKLAAQINHPNVVKVYTGAMNEQGAYYTMEYIAGKDAEKYFIEQVDIPISGDKRKPGILDTALLAARGLAAMHEKGIVHRDVKLANLMIASNSDEDFDYVKIADPGLAKYLQQEPSAFETNVGEVVGTPAFMAPEQIDGQVNAKSDVWALGASLYMLLVREFPFDGNNIMSVMLKAKEGLQSKQLEKLKPFAKPIRELVISMMELDHTKRPAMAEVVEKLEKLYPQYAGVGSIESKKLRISSQETQILEIETPQENEVGETQILKMELPEEDAQTKEKNQQVERELYGGYLEAVKKAKELAEKEERAFRVQKEQEQFEKAGTSEEARRKIYGEQPPIRKQGFEIKDFKLPTAKKSLWGRFKGLFSR